MGIIKDAISNLIGLSAELNAARKERKELSKADGRAAADSSIISSEAPDAKVLDGESDLDSDNEAWILDEAAGQADLPNDAAVPQTSAELQAGKRPTAVPDLIKLVLNSPGLSPPTYTGDEQPLPGPVILPQRRPGARNRGFVRAYAPDLAAAGIDEATFLTFLKMYQHAQQASPIYETVVIGGLSPSILATAACTLANSAAQATKEVTGGRGQGQQFLAGMNKHLFRPRGLFALVMCFKPGAGHSVSLGQFDETTSIVQTAMTDQAGLSTPKAVAGTTEGEMALPYAVPLVFPGVDQKSSESKKALSNSKVIANYFDKRAQAKYAAQNPGSSLTQQRPSFASRFGDPTHAANQGGLVSLVSGGTIGKGKRRAGMQNLFTADGTPATQAMGRRGARVRGRGGVLRGRIIKNSVLYLMVTNLPSEQELTTAQHDIDLADEKDAEASAPKSEIVV
ncbi:uncharacterized protein L969DRAFT_17243 [Mixia osmundae IAM 14324]|uniref:Uncharacterized protein n=1 Tax=Mixia osmundae (strain CBS 9802 / IAM 14324 / JCM 22182 / KY 12970) TaxID=764103 RepID=G7E3C5_MIXOS|nr:uncharacterized protein L969DRAFT_17243 [Mixia osmundae IAM 14324]KEI39321.1 hypothetical protein L969DRAFT_17243 [Mixia osmundae IAM 14324]GAA97335.1 hypothetical protein E5Q_04013 [Mixia osmundae IAM 14324]